MSPIIFKIISTYERNSEFECITGGFNGAIVYRCAHEAQINSTGL